MKVFFLCCDGIRFNTFWTMNAIFSDVSVKHGEMDLITISGSGFIYISTLNPVLPNFKIFSATYWISMGKFKNPGNKLPVYNHIENKVYSHTRTHTNMSASTPSTTPAFSSTLTQAIQIADQITRRCSASMQWFVKSTVSTPLSSNTDCRIYSGVPGTHGITSTKTLTRPIQPQSGTKPTPSLPASVSAQP